MAQLHNRVQSDQPLQTFARGAIAQLGPDRLHVAVAFRNGRPDDAAYAWICVRYHPGDKVINYAQWRSLKDFEAMRQNPKAKPHMEAVAAVATFEPILCEVVESIGVNA